MVQYPNLKILIIEDNENQIELFKLSLPFDLTFSKEIPKNLNYDVIILDLCLNFLESSKPSLSNLEKIEPKDKCVVVLTSVENLDFCLEAIKLGAEDYIYKTNFNLGEDFTMLIMKNFYRYERRRKKNKY